MKKILVPCDFSEPAINAFRFALDVAAHAEGEVHLLNIIDLPVTQDPIIVPVMTFDQDFLKDLKETALQEFEKMTTRYNKDNVQVVPVVEFGSTSHMIHDYIEKQAMDLIVMGSHGSSGLNEFFFGSNAEKVVRRATVPVLVLKDYYKGPIRNIVFPHTLETKNQEDLVHRIQELQAFFKARVHLVYVNTPTHFFSDTVTLTRMKEFATAFQFKDYTLNIFNHHYEEEGIIHFAKSIQADMIAMGTHGRKGISHILNGSIAEDVVNHSEFPIWTYAQREAVAVT